MCGVSLDSPLSCQACHALQEPEREPTPHELFGLAPGLAVCPRSLERKLMQLSRSLHPDFFGTAAPEVRELAERNIARLNDAYRLLSDPVAHADWWIRHLGGPSEQDERQMPQAFLMEVLEWNEAIDAADAADEEGGDDRTEALRELESQLSAERERLLGQLARDFETLPDAPPDLTAARQQLNAVRYLDRALARIRGAHTSL